MEREEIIQIFEQHLKVPALNNREKQVARAMIRTIEIFKEEVKADDR